MMKDFYAKGGVSISEAAMNKEFDSRPTYSLQQQLAALDRKGAQASQMEAWFNDLSAFMRDTGAVQQVPNAADFVTGEYLQRVQADPKLRAMATAGK
jgi:NitT/TauT family transport system substrate-binding protein